MDLSELKDDLPDVQIKVNGVIHTGHIRGRLLDFAKVYVPAVDASYEFAWKSVLHCVNNGLTLSA